MGMQDVNAALFGTQTPTVSFKVGDEIEGTLLDCTMVHERRYEKTPGVVGALLYWGDDNKTTTQETDRPKKVPVLTIQTSLRDPEIKGDDGKRRLFLKGRSKDNPGAPLDTFRKAVKDAGAAELEVGAYVWMKCVSQEDPDDRQSAKYYESVYRIPADNTHETRNMINEQAVKTEQSGGASAKRDPFAKAKATTKK